MSAAADQQDIAKSAVSRRLKELEAHLGVELFHRTTRKLKLTETGRAYYQQCIRILDDLAEVEMSTSQAHGNIKGGLRVALPSSFGVAHIGPAISDFLRDYPDIEFDLDFNDREVDLMQDGFDLAIRIARLPDSSLIARRLAPIRRVICASPGYIESHGNPHHPTALVTHRTLAYSIPRNVERWPLVDSKGNQIRVKLKPFLRGTSGEFLRDAAVAGNGIALLPSFLIYQEIARGELIQIIPEFSAPEINAYAIYPQTRHLSQRVRTFVDFLSKRFEGQPYWDMPLDQ